MITSTQPCSLPSCPLTAMALCCSSCGGVPIVSPTPFLWRRHIFECHAPSKRGSSICHVFVFILGAAGGALLASAWASLFARVNRTRLAVVQGGGRCGIGGGEGPDRKIRDSDVERRADRKKVPSFARTSTI